MRSGVIRTPSALPAEGLNVAGFTLSRAGVLAPDGASFDDWQRLGDFLSHCEGAIHWWIGDWLNHGEQKFGEACSQAIGGTGFEYNTLANDKWVSARLEISRRRENLSWSHHREVAALDAPDQESLLAAAEQEGWTLRELRSKARSFRRAATVLVEAPPVALDGEAPAVSPADPWRVVNAPWQEGLEAHVVPGSVRLAFMDPPYNVGVDYGDGPGEDLLPPDEYVALMARCFRGVRDCLTDDGSLWVLIGDEYAAELGCALKAEGFTVRSWVKWYETFGVNCANKFNRTSRHLFYCPKDPDRFVFRRDAVSRPSDRQAKYDDPRADPDGKLLDDVWTDIPRLAGTHAERIPEFPTQLPLALLRRVVACASDPGDLVLDPFSGSATTGVAALELGRRYVGLEKSARFAELSTLRLKGVRP